ncbi:glycosyltransferase family 4 protein [Paenarthrobacter sp. TA1.8]|uniref:glycosyltransferase family 4 protein n=1 Tax=Paenarthrobacter sp. TA1.8 TaxID=3400219 RepID=UPI003B43B393
MSTPTYKLVIVQPYVPAYRLAFFEKLISSLSTYGIDCRVAASDPDHEQSKRGDATKPSWVIPVRQRRIKVGSRSINLGGSRKAWSAADAVIVGLVGSSLDTYLALMDSRFRRLKIGLWGHVKPYVSPGNRLDLWLERLQMKLADEIFAYTKGGRDFAEAGGIASDKITTVMNAVDTGALEDAVLSTSEEEAASFSALHSVDPSKTLAFVGGLDSSKRIEFLAESLERIWELDPSVKFLIGGLGPDSHHLAPAVARGQAITLGYVDAKQMALLARSVKGIVMPGRIGLVAVDALVLGLPVITTDWAFHAPESEYLTEGSTRFTSPDSPEAYADAVVSFIAQPAVDRVETPWFPTIDDMVANFTTGILRMLKVAERDYGSFADTK